MSRHTRNIGLRINLDEDSQSNDSNTIYYVIVK